MTDIFEVYSKDDIDEKFSSLATPENISNINAQLADIVTPKAQGAKADGTTDDTTAIQNAVNLCPSGGIVNGQGLTYLVTKIKLKSNMSFINFNFTYKAGGSENDFQSPVCIGENNDTTQYHDIFVDKVFVNGNRINQTGIGTTEDGGRSGFRLIGNLYNIKITNSSATYCATDGLELYSGVGTRASGIASNAPLQERIFIENCDFSWNRRQGGSGDSLKNAYFKKCTFNNNGQDLSGATTQGGLGALDGNGNKYANGFDMEGYGIGSMLDGVIFDKCQAIQNIRSGILFYDPTDQTTSGFTPRKNIRIIDCDLDSGTIPNSGNQALEFTGLVANNSKGNVYEDIIIRGTNLTGALDLRSVQRVTLDGGGEIVTTNNSLGNLDYALDVVVGAVQTYNKVFNAPSNSRVKYTTPLFFNMQPGQVVDLGLVRTATFGTMKLICLDGGAPVGGTFAVDVYLNGGSGVTIKEIYNGVQVVSSGTTGAILIDLTQYDWTIKNINANAFNLMVILETN